MKKTFHYAVLGKSPRLKELLAFLIYRGTFGATTLEICRHCYSTRASSDISELRRNGVRIETKFEGTSKTGKRIYRYTMKTGKL